MSHKEKTRWFSELLKVQEEISVRRCASMVGKTVRGLVEEEASKPGVLNARTEENVTVEIPGGPGNDRQLSEYFGHWRGKLGFKGKLYIISAANLYRK